MTERKNTNKNTLRNEPKPIVEEKIGKRAKDSDNDKGNSYRSEPKADKSTKTEKKAKTERKKFKIKISDKLVRILGLFLLLSSIYLVLAFASFLFTWKYDLAFPVNGGWGSVMSDRSIFAENVLGKFGTMLADLFIYKWFGVASFGFVFLFFILGFKLTTSFTILPLSKTIRFTLFLMIWTSIASSLLFTQDNFLIFGGNFGYQSKLWLMSLLGNAGTAILLIFTMIGFFVLAFDAKFAWIKGLIPDKKEDLEESKPQYKTTPRTSSTFNYSSSSKNNQEDEIDEDSLTEEELMELEPILVTKKEELQNPIIAQSFNAKVEELDETDDDDEEGEIELADIKEKIAEEPILISKIEKKQPELILETIIPEAEPIVEEVVSTKNEEIPGLELTINEGIPFSIEKVEDPIQDAVLQKDDIEDLAEQIVAEFGTYDPRLDLSNFQFPSVDLLEQYSNKTNFVNKEELEENKNKIVTTLANYGIGIAQIKATIGPTVTLYEIVPEAGVRISKIKNLEDDIALSLAALGIRIIAPIPGKGTIGIEVPNQTPEIVSMHSVVSSEKFQRSTMDLPIVLGKTITNETFTFDLAKMPHLLMAGATGQGKSVGLNAILTSLLYKKHPAELKFILVDPKKVELTLYNKIERHYLAKLPNTDEAIITDTKKVVSTLNSLCIEMDNRYNLLKDAMVRNIKEYNEKFMSRRLNPENGHRFLPYIVLVVDEFADLIQTAGRDVEGPIARLAQLARAIGIHLIIATQRPSVNVITGLIKANFPARIAFRVTSKIDSRTILDSGGADQLIGRGDLLFSTGNDLTRVQCAFVDTPEVERIAEFIGNQRGYPDAFLLPEVQDEQSEGNGDVDASDRDPLFADAARVIVQHQQGSTSLIQRKMKLGYNRAGRIIDQLESAGIVGPFEGSKAREVRIKDMTTLEQLLIDIN